MKTEICGLCGKTAQGYAVADGVRLCHPDDPQMLDCYHLWTVYGARKIERRTK